jgi:hypothetical protein
LTFLKKLKKVLARLTAHSTATESKDVLVGKVFDDQASDDLHHSKNPYKKFLLTRKCYQKYVRKSFLNSIL